MPRAGSFPQTNPTDKYTAIRVKSIAVMKMAAPKKTKTPFIPKVVRGEDHGILPVNFDR